MIAGSIGDGTHPPRGFPFQQARLKPRDFQDARYRARHGFCCRHQRRITQQPFGINVFFLRQFIPLEPQVPQRRELPHRTQLVAALRFAPPLGTVLLLIEGGHEAQVCELFPGNTELTLRI